MPEAVVRSEPPATAPALYATFPRRLNALSTDSLILIAYSALVFFLVPVLEAAPRARTALVAAWIGSLFLYDPVLVSWLGGTLGHRMLNLRVVDDRSGGNLGFWKAFARVWIKGFFGIFSFFTMAFSRRHRAIHDMATGSTVQIRDAARAEPHHYVTGRAGA